MCWTASQNLRCQRLMGFGVGIALLKLEATDKKVSCLLEKVAKTCYFQLSSKRWFEPGSHISTCWFQSIAHLWSSLGTCYPAVSARIPRHAFLQQRLAHFAETLASVGFGRRLFDHRCVFCNLALGGVQMMDQRPSHPWAIRNTWICWWVWVK